MYRFPSAARHQKKNGPAGNRRDTARGASQAKPVNASHCVSDDEHGHFLIGHVRNERRESPQEPSPPSHVENRRNSSKSHPGWEHVSTVESSIARPQSLHQRAQRPCPRTGRRPTTATAETPQFSAQPTKSPVIAQQQARHTQPNCTCESPRLAQCALCVPRSAAAGMSTTLLMN